MGAAAGGDAAESPGDGLVTNRGPGTAAPASSTSCRPKMTHSRRQGQPAAITTTAACARAPPHPRHVARSGSGAVSLGVPLGEGPRLRGRRTLAPRPKGRRGTLTHSPESPAMDAHRPQSAGLTLRPLASHDDYHACYELQLA